MPRVRSRLGPSLLGITGLVTPLLTWLNVGVFPFSITAGSGPATYKTNFQEMIDKCLINYCRLNNEKYMIVQPCSTASEMLITFSASAVAGAKPPLVSPSFKPSEEPV